MLTITSPRSRQDSAPVVGNGLVFHQDGLQRGQPLVGGPGINVRNPDGREGKPIIEALPQGAVGRSLRLPAHQVAETAIPIVGAALYRITSVMVLNATAAPAELRAGLYTLPAGGGEQLLAPTTAYPLAAERYASIEIPLPASLTGARAAPFLYWQPSVPNTAELYIDVYVLGTILELSA